MTSDLALRTQQLGKAKLASSGLTLEDAKILNIGILTGQQVAKLAKYYMPVPSLQLTYHDLSGKPVGDWPTATPYFRLRYLSKVESFDGIADAKKKDQRYAQPAKSIPMAYYPKNFDWTKLADDTDQPVLITEGELKAAKACKEGFPTIGLGGVSSWKAVKHGLRWIPSLDWIQWLRRDVYICFDSDYRTNPAVCAALWDLAKALQEKGAFPFIMSLPQVPNVEKTGLDDFLVSGPEAPEHIGRIIMSSEPLGMVDPLFDINKSFTYVQDPGLIINTKTMAKISPAAFRDHSQSAVPYVEHVLAPSGSVLIRTTSAAEYWIKWPIRSEVTKLTYRPGMPERFEEGVHKYYNIWSGWGIEPKAGDVKPFIELINHIFTGADEKAKTWFLRWLAYPLKFPGTKMFSSAVIHGIKQGTGKSLIGYTMQKIYKQNFAEISQGDLHNNFNEWAEGKQFVMGDDVAGSTQRQDADFLKKLITQQELRVNMKYVPTYVIPDCINYFFTANHPDTFFLDDDDRRFFIHDVIVGPLDQQFYTDYAAWLNGPGGAAVFHYLLNLDLGNFNHAAPAYKTAAKDRMITGMQSDIATWVRQLISNPDQILRVGDIIISKDLFTSTELLQFYDPMGKGRITANGVGRELARAGVHQIADGKPIRLANGIQARYFIIRNHEDWIVLPTSKAIEHLNECEKKQPVEKKVKY